MYPLTLIITNSTFVPWTPPIKPAVDNGNLNVSANIHSINRKGDMVIVFNATMATKFNFSLLNETNLDIYIKPAEGR